MKHKDAKVTTTTITANEKLSLHAIRRAERLAVLEELVTKIESIDFYSYVYNAPFSAGVDRMKEAMLDAIKSMKEAAK